MGYFGNHSPDTLEFSKRASDDTSVVSRFARIVAITDDSAVARRCFAAENVSCHRWCVGRDEWRKLAKLAN